MHQVSVFNAYAIAGGVMVLFFLLACLCANLINYKPDKSDYKTRKINMILLGIASLFIGLAANYFFVLLGIKIPSHHNDYLTHMCIAAVVMIVLYYLLAFVCSKVMKNTKLGTWF